MSQTNDDLLLQRVLQFTDIEDTGLALWLDLENSGLEEQAATFLNVALKFEHYLSQLANDPAQRTPVEVETLETLRADFAVATDAGRAALAQATKAPGKYCWKCGTKLR